MKRETAFKIPDTSGTTEDFVWATNEQAKQRAVSLYHISSIVEKHGGTLEIDTATDTLNITVPEKKRVACAQEIEKHMAAVSR